MRSKTIIAIETCVHKEISKKAKEQDYEIGKFVELLFIEHVERKIDTKGTKKNE